jgi:RimJ/RimL family protein N-acetyltransferase
MIETQRLLLRQLTRADADFILELLNEPSFIENIGDKNVRTTADACVYISTSSLYLVELKDPQIAIGICGLLKRDYLEDVDIGFAFLERFWSKGYAHESASAVMNYGLNVLKLPRIVAITAPDNQGSINVLTKLGLRYEKMVNLPGHTAESRFFTSDLPAH